MAFAHSANDLGIRHDLVSHLKDVARLAAQFAANFCAGDKAARGAQSDEAAPSTTGLTMQCCPIVAGGTA
jgi:hypothetical protein